MIEEVDRHRLAHLTGLYSNGNYDPQKEGEEGARKKLIELVEEHYDSIKRAIWEGDEEPEVDPEVEAMMDSPFMRASRRNVLKVVGPHIPGEDQVKDYFSGQ